ncbi:hypothetical protein E2C01_076502 [Portunus trituberculatus]|uniref:Obg domain-containing protein n=1 Tax=Portunus trituberculatus TaxID=210409 RepID=A0A5B7INQ9_PORTR|nr:hypothetical protein [Portunus trituberculatus]
MKRARTKFVDMLRLHVRGGPGGMGLPRLGGVGGKGGDVYVEGKEGEALKHFVCYDESDMETISCDERGERKGDKILPTLI